MTVNQDAQKLIDEAVTTLKQTTVGYAGHGAAWQNNKTTKWWQGLDKLAQARALLDPAPPPPPVDPPPPVTGLAGTAGLDLNGNRWPSGFTGTPSLVTVAATNAKDAASKHPYVLMYTDSVIMRGAYWTGVDVPWAQQHGVVRAVDGDRYCGDLANPVYQNEWARQVIAEAKAAGVFGVFVDDVCQNIPGLIAGYQSWQQGADAMVSFIAAVAPKLKAAGLYVVLNADGFVSRVGGDDGQLQIEWWKRLKPYVPALMQEAWLQNINDYSQMRTNGWGYWSGWQQLCKWAGDNGVQFVGLTYGPSDNVEYARASALKANPGAIVTSTAWGAWGRKPTSITVDPDRGVGDLG